MVRARSLLLGIFSTSATILIFKHLLPSTIGQGDNLINQLNSYKFAKNQRNKNSIDAVYDLYIEDIFIAVMSTRALHSTRLELLLDTWIPQAASSVYIITDRNDKKYSRMVGKRNFITTQCGATRQPKDLVCKLQATYDLFLKKEKYKWMCTVYDDMYVIVANLVRTLRRYDYQKNWYIGKPSLNHKFQVVEHSLGQSKEIYYWFATGGAGVCISRGLARRMVPLCGDGKFRQRAETIENADDTTLGYIINYLLGVELTVIPEFHSPVEPLWELKAKDLPKQVTLSWGNVTASNGALLPNRLLIRDEFRNYPKSVDPTRLLSLHCYLYPNSRQCRNIVDRLGNLK